MVNEVLSAAILFTFTILVLVGATTTTRRALRYRRLKIEAPVLLGRDRDLFLGLAIPFAIIAAVRAFELQWLVLDPSGAPHLWYLLLTGIPPIYALARYDWFELFVIEKVSRNPDIPETENQRDDRVMGDERRRLPSWIRRHPDK